MASVGGDPAELTGGSREIHDAGASIGDLAGAAAADTRGAAGAAGDPALSSSLHRLAALTHGLLEDTGTQARTAAQLASAAAEDLRAATGST